MTVDGVRRPAPQPFMVIATQNPVEQAGTYPLPEAQLDRFLMKTSIGYPSRSAMIDVLDGSASPDRSKNLKPLLSGKDIVAWAALASANHTDRAVLDYVAALAEATREDESSLLGVSTRGAIGMVRCARVWAAAQGRNFVLPDDIKALAVPVWAHRVIVDPDAAFSGATAEGVIQRALTSVPTRPSARKETPDTTMEGMRTDTPTMVSPKRAQAVRSHPLKTLVGAVTTTGWAVITLVIVGLALAVAFQWVEALACALAGVVALVLAAMRVAWRPPHVVSIRVPNERIVAGQTAVGEISVRNERARSVRSGIIELPIGTGTGEFVVPPLGAHETWDEMFLISSRHRGLINVGPARAVRSDALGLLRRVRMWDEPVLLHVHPRTVRVPFDATGFQLDVEGVATGKLSSSDVSFHALRDYEPGDDRRAVHWQSTARLGKLIVRQYEETHRSHHVIVLDTSRDAWDHDAFETAVSVAGSLGLANLRESRPVSLTTTEGWLPSGVAMRMLDALSEVKARSFGDLSRRVREAVAQRPGVSALTLIVGPNVTDTEAAHLARLAPIDVPVSIIRIGAEGVRARRDLGRGVLLDCSTLDDLPRIIVAGGLA